MILTEDTTHSAVGEKDCTRTSYSTNRWFLTVMGKNTRDNHLAGCSAEPDLPFETVIAASARTKRTGGDFLISRLDLLRPCGIRNISVTGLLVFGVAIYAFHKSFITFTIIRRNSYDECLLFQFFFDKEY